MDQDKFNECGKYFEERVFGITTYFQQGYLTITAYSVFDVLRFIINTEPEFLFCPDIQKLSSIVGIRLPKQMSEIDFWKDWYLNITEITKDIKKSYDAVMKK